MAMPQTITSLYAWIATQADGSEGVPGMQLEVQGVPMMMPLMGADQERLDSLREYVEMIASYSPGVRMRLCRFDLVEEIEEL
jgi:hypothetical protein